MLISGIDELLIRIEKRCKQNGLSQTTQKKKEYVTKLIFSQLWKAQLCVIAQLRTKTGKTMTIKTVNTVKAEVSWILHEIFGINLSEHPKIKDILKRKPVSGAMIRFSEFQKILELVSGSWK